MQVLLVEHHRLLAQSLKWGLEEEGFSVTVARDEVSAYSEVTAADYDVIILNPRLPAEDGLALLGRWRHEGLTTPVLVLTARGGGAEQARLAGLGAEDCLGLPFELDDLLARLRSLTRAGRVDTRPRHAAAAKVFAAPSNRRFCDAS
jgi:DNA-binding response OmpR family regulator